MNSRIVVAVYSGGRTCYGPHGITYDPDIPKASFWGTPQTSFLELRSKICQKLKLNESRVELRIISRVNASTVDLQFEPVSVNDEEEWTLVKENSFCGNYRRICPFVDVEPLAGIDRDPQVTPPVQPECEPRREQWSVPQNVPNIAVETDDGWETLTHESESDDNRFVIDPSGFATGEDYTTAEEVYTDTDSEMGETDDNWINDKRTLKYDIDRFRIFDSKAALVATVQRVCIRMGKIIKTTQSTPQMLQVKCTKADCHWYLTAKAIGTQWQIREIPYEHGCHIVSNKRYSQLTSTLIAQTILDALRKDTGMTIKAIKNLVTPYFPQVFYISYMKCWKAREKAMTMLFGDWVESYELLTSLFLAIESTNPDFQWDVRSERHPDFEPAVVQRFKMAAWSFGPCYKAWPHLRPVVSIDACFLSGRYSGRLLTMVGYDADNKLVPLAFGIVEEENVDNWGAWMLWVRKNVIRNDKQEICVISDSHQAIKAVLRSPLYGWDEQQRQAAHRLCMHHIAENLYSHVRDDTILKIFKWTAKRCKLRRFDDGMNAIRSLNPDAYQYLLGVGKYSANDPHEQPKPYRWAQCKDYGFRWGMRTSNGNETLNSVFKMVRRFPITAIVEHTFSKCNEWFVKRRDEVMTLRIQNFRWSDRVTKIINSRLNKAAKNEVINTNSATGEYTVRNRGEFINATMTQDFNYTVSMRHENGQLPRCTCQKPQLTGIPCVHVYAVCLVSGYDIGTFVSPAYSISNLTRTWSRTFYAYPTKDSWPTAAPPRIIPDAKKIVKGRRPRKRRAMVMDNMEDAIRFGRGAFGIPGAPPIIPQRTNEIGTEGVNTTPAAPPAVGLQRKRQSSHTGDIVSEIASQQSNADPATDPQEPNPATAESSQCRIRVKSVCSRGRGSRCSSNSRRQAEEERNDMPTGPSTSRIIKQSRTVS